MKKGKLVKEKNNWKIQGEKTTPVYGNFGLTEDLNGQEVEFDNSGGPVKFILHRGKKYEKIFSDLIHNERKNMYHKGMPQHKQQSSFKERYQTSESFAPYNFVPLNDSIINQESFTEHHVYRKDCLSGYIELSIETKTPLFIRGNDNNFLRVNDQPIIPGSSLRGMIREIVEIVSFGKMYYVTDSTLFKRRVHNEGESRAGFLHFEQGRYFIMPGTAKQLDKISENEFNYTFNTHESYCEFTTGSFGRNNIKVWQIYKIKGNKIKVPISLKKSYQDEDITRSGKVPNVFECSKSESVKGIIIPKEIGMPIFYTLDTNGNLESISHCKLGRMPYGKKIHDHIPDAIVDNKKNESIIDFATSIFGNTEFATRVFFEDAFLTEPNDNVYLGIDIQPKILASPKPTSYQLYLEPNNQGKAQDWNSNSNIRGHKMYWHRQTPHDESNYSWKERNDKTDSHPAPICPIKPDVAFTGRVRFENLTEIELGCLLTALELPENCAHKLGMAKPLGLGSIKINVELKRIDRKVRYASLFNEGNINEAISYENTASYKTNFQDLVKTKLNQTVAFWEIPRLKELYAMLEWVEDINGQNKWLEKTRYMEIERERKLYSQKAVLPRPSNNPHKTEKKRT